MPPGGMPAPSIPNYLVQAILCTLFCCRPAGIVAIVCAAQVNSKLGMGARAGAMQSPQNAKTWVWVSFGVAVIYGIIIVVATGSTRS